MTVIRAARLGDVDGIAQLLDRYYIGHLSDSQKARGFISVTFATAELESMVLETGAVVGVSDDESVVAVAGSSSIPSIDGRGVFQKIDELVDQITYNGKMLSQYRLVMYGPVCVDETCAGQGLATRLWQGFVALEQGRYELGLAFVSHANTASLKVHVNKLGMTQLTDFDAEGRSFALLAFDIPV